MAARFVASRRLRLRPALLTTPVPYLVLLALVLLAASRRPSYLSIGQLSLTTTETFSLVLVATGQTIVLLAGGLDLSVGGVISLTTALAATRFGSGLGSIAVWTVLLLLLGIAVGIVNGFVVYRLRMQPFIATLATWSILAGCALLVLPTPGGAIPAAWIHLGNAAVAGVSIWVFALGLLLAFWIVFGRRPLGRAIKAVGSNREAAHLAGVRVGLTLVGAYALSGLFASLCGLYLVTQTAGGSPLIGDDFILPSVAAAVIGGTRLTGGSASLAGTIAGAFVLTVIADVVFLFGIARSWSIVLSGGLLLLAVMLGEVGRLLLRRREHAV